MARFDDRAGLASTSQAADVWGVLFRRSAVRKCIDVPSSPTIGVYRRTKGSHHRTASSTPAPCCTSTCTLVFPGIQRCPPGRSNRIPPVFDPGTCNLGSWVLKHTGKLDALAIRHIITMMQEQALVASATIGAMAKTQSIGRLHCRHRCSSGV